jgi:ABC-type antimicrobial peptide transport system permease subunit
MRPEHWIYTIPLRLRSLFRRREADQELDEELRYHVECKTEEYIARGMTPQEARRAALLEMGGVEKRKEECRDTRRVNWIQDLAQDVRYGLRMLRKSPGFTAVALLTIGLGVGSNIAIFTVVHAVLLNHLPYPNSDRLAIIESGLANELRAPASSYEVAQLRQRSRLFDRIDGIWVTNSLVPGEGEPEQVKLGEVTDNFLTLLCARPLMGRFFTTEDALSKGPTAFVISYSLWQRRFGGDPGVIGRTLHVGENAVTVIGVLPQDFRLIFPDDSNVPTNVDLFMPIPVDFSEPDGPAFIHTIGLLHPGANFAQAQSEADGIAAELRHLVPGFAAANFSLHVAPLHEDDVRTVRRTLVLLFGGVAFVLLIACVNIANLLLARTNFRAREMTIRAALGATRSRTIRQLLTESIALGLIGGAAALAIGWGALKALIALRPESLLRLATIELDTTAFVYTLAISVFCGILFGLVPAFVASRVDLLAALKGAARGATAGRQPFRAVLVAAEVSLSFALLIGTGLLVRTFLGVLRVNPGFQPENVSHLPFDDTHGNWYDTYYPEGAPPEQQSTNFADCRSILPGYFRTIGATLFEGRDFTDVDDASHQHVAIIDEELAHEAWPGQDPLGKKLNVSDSPKGPYQFERDWVVVVGVIEHVQYHSLTTMVRAQIYVPFQLAPRPVSYVVRASTPIATLTAQIREQLSNLDKSAPVARVIPLSELVDHARAQSRFVAVLTAALGALALILACIGIAGVTSYSVAQRTSEIGIRMTLGAAPGEVLSMIIRQNIRPVIAGIAFGSVVSLVLTPLLQNLLFGVKPADPLTFACVAILLGVAALAACYLPARRAVRVDPMVALRYE